MAHPIRILFPCGYDSTAEEGRNNVAAALARGYNAVSFEGPGQGAALYERGLFFRPDFDTILTLAFMVSFAVVVVDAWVLMIEVRQ